jgi:hypothetical protein
LVWLCGCAVRAGCVCVCAREGGGVREGWSLLRTQKRDRENGYEERAALSPLCREKRAQCSLSSEARHACRSSHDTLTHAGLPGE